MPPSYDVAVIGGGISGLAAAYGAHRAGASVIVLDAGETPGGVVSTTCLNGFTIERGPNTFAVSTRVDALLAELGLANDIILPSPAAKRRYIVRGGKTHAMPGSPPAFLASRLFSMSGKLRALAEPLIPKARSDAPEESVASLVQRRFGREVLDYAVDPFVSGVYAGNPDELTSRHALKMLSQFEQQHGSIIAGAVRGARSHSRIVSFRRGLEQLPQAFSRALPTAVRTSVHVERIERVAQGWKVAARTSTGAEVFKSAALVVAVPAYSLPGIAWPAELGTGLEKLATVRYAPVATVAFGFSRDSVSHPLAGFGLLVPTIEKRGILGAMFTSTLFADRAPGGQVLLTVFMGGSRTRSLPPDDELVRVALSELQTLVGLSAPPTMVLPTRWELGIPQFMLGHDAVISRAKALEGAFPGFVLAGSYLDGVALGECVENGLAAGQRAVMQMKREVRNAH